MEPKHLAGGALIVGALAIVALMPSETLQLLTILILGILGGGAALVGAVVYAIHSADNRAAANRQAGAEAARRSVSVQVETAGGRARVAADIGGDRIAAELEEGASLRIDTRTGSTTAVEAGRRRIAEPTPPGRPGRPREAGRPQLPMRRE